MSYDPNGATSGNVPASQVKTNGVPLTLAVNSGNLAKGGHAFGGWNTAANGTGTAYAAGASYTDDASATLYANWLTNTPPTITAPPTNITVMAGQSATFSVTASGSAPLFYQWYTNDAAIIGSTGTNHTTAVTITNDSGRRFKVTVTNAYGAVTSSVATLTVNAVPTGGVSATGGTVASYVRNGTNFTVHIFTNSGMLTVNNGGSGIVIVRYVTAVVPVAPTGLVATVVGKDRIDLTWTDSAANETGYVVGRSLDSNNWVFVAMTAAGATNCTDNGLVTNTLYYHRVAASNAAGLSAYAYASATTWTLYEAWRKTYFTAAQLSNSAVSGDSADPDHDGANNADEFAAGTNPTDAASLLTMYTATDNLVANGMFLVRWQSVSGKTYTVMAATNLVSGFNQTLGASIPATPPMNVHTDTTSGVLCKFYRVLVE